MRTLSGLATCVVLLVACGSDQPTETVGPSSTQGSAGSMSSTDAAGGAAGAGGMGGASGGERTDAATSDAPESDVPTTCSALASLACERYGQCAPHYLRVDFVDG